MGDNAKSALMAGLVEAAVALPTDVPSGGEVHWADGTRATVPLVSAPRAFAAIRSGPVSPCPECTPLEVVSARLTSTEVATSRGAATVPAWEFGLRGTAVRLTRVAIADSHVVIPPAAPPQAPGAIAIENATVSSDGRQLTVAFVGSPYPGDRPCGADYTATAVESSLGVVVIVTEHPFPVPAPCSAVGAWRRATASLDTPLGARAVLDPMTGQPIATTWRQADQGTGRPSGRRPYSRAVSVAPDSPSVAT